MYAHLKVVAHFSILKCATIQGLLCTWKHVHTCTYMHISVHICVCMCMYAHLKVPVSLRILKCATIQGLSSLRVYICIYTCICIYTYTYIPTHIGTLSIWKHVYTYTHMHVKHLKPRNNTGTFIATFPDYRGMYMYLICIYMCQTFFLDYRGVCRLFDVRICVVIIEVCALSDVHMCIGTHTLSSLCFLILEVCTLLNVHIYVSYVLFGLSRYVRCACFK